MRKPTIEKPTSQSSTIRCKHHSRGERLRYSLLVRRLMAAPLPRWMVFLADLLLAMISVLVVLIGTHEVVYLTSYSLTASLSWFLKFAIVTSVYGLVMMVLGTYKYVVRLSVLRDVYRVIVTVVSATAILEILAVVTRLCIGQQFMSFWNILVTGTLAFTMMLLLRLFIKYMYGVMRDSANQRVPVVILGNSLQALGVTSTLREEPGGKYFPVGLINLGGGDSATTVNGIPMVPYNPATVGQFFNKVGSNTLIFLPSEMGAMRQGVADVFLENHVKLLKLNQVHRVDAVDSKTLESKEGNISTNVRDIRIEDLLGRDTIDLGYKEVAPEIKGSVVLITGAAGSIGSEIVRQVARLGASDIVLLDQAETPMHEMQLMMRELYPDSRIHLFIADVANKGRLRQAFEEFHPRFVYHAAAYKHVPMMENNPSEAVINNVQGTRNVADLAVEFGVEKFVMVSTDKAVNPTNIMGCSKRIAEIYVQSLYYHNLQEHPKGDTTAFVTTRFGNVLGSNGSVIPLFRSQIEKGGPVTVTHKDIIRYFMTIPEACSLVIEAGCMGHGGEIFVFDMGQPVRIYDLATRMISLAGLTPGQDIKIVETGLRPGEKLYEDLLNDAETTLPTPNAKIKVAKVRQYEYGDVNDALDALVELARQGDHSTLVAQMKHIVPEYKSRNSRWEVVDRQIEEEEKKETTSRQSE